jgi:hypothetical protein
VSCQLTPLPFFIGMIAVCEGVEIFRFQTSLEEKSQLPHPRTGHNSRLQLP